MWLPEVGGDVRNNKPSSKKISSCGGESSEQEALEWRRNEVSQETNWKMKREREREGELFTGHVIKMIDHAYKEVQSLLQTLRSSSSSSSKRKKALDEEIRDAVCKFEDLLQSHLLGQEIISIDLGQDVESFAQTLKKMQEAYANELDPATLQEDNDEASVSSRNISKMVGLDFSEVFNQIRSEFTKSWPLHVFALSGMAGIGKTTVARHVCNDLSIKRDFEHIVWVKIGQNYELSRIKRDIVVGLVNRAMDGDEDVSDEDLRESLKGKRCIIVLDDAWDTRVWEYLFYSILKAINGCYRILVTTRLQQVAESMDFSAVLHLLDKDESWDLLRERVFGQDSCPYNLEKAGKKIAENCDGLPLTIVTVARLLSKAERSPQYWRMIAERKCPLFFLEAESTISKELRPSYDYLPPHLKTYFLYMGVFPEKFEIPPTKLINLWDAEGLLEPKKTQTLQQCAIECLKKLSSQSLIIFIEKTSDPYMSFGDRLKSCRLQSSYWKFCNREAASNNFFHALDNHDFAGVKGQPQRRLCIQNNILCTIKEEYKLLQDSSALSARSLLCCGPHHRYQVPIGFSFRLLKVLDALTIRFYEFPVEVMKLVQLKYLALTCNGDLPPSISDLRALRFLIICRYSSIMSYGAPTFAPMEIWDMLELKHIQIMGSNLPFSKHGACLRNLLTLVGVSAHTCTKGVLKRIPYLEKLGIRIELVPDDDHSKPFRRLNQISRLRRLHALKCVVVNPEVRAEADALPPPAPISMFPSSLRKLHLSGLGYPWEYMGIIGSIPCLHVLKLRNYAFRGAKWEIEENAFRLLQFLVIEDTDFVQWKVGSGSLGHLVHASIKHCYNLEEIDWECEFVTDKVEIVDCNPLAVESLNQIKSRQHYRFKDLNVHSSWDDGKKKS